MLHHIVIDVQRNNSINVTFQSTRVKFFFTVKSPISHAYNLIKLTNIVIYAVRSVGVCSVTYYIILRLTVTIDSNRYDCLAESFLRIIFIIMTTIIVTDVLTITFCLLEYTVVP